MRPLLPRLLATLLMTSAFALSAAEGITEPAAIRDAALEALGVAGTGSQAMVDSALRLAACTTALQATPTGPRTVQVRCADIPGWRLYVPVRVRKEVEVVVLTRPVPAGQAITADHVTLRRRDVGHKDGAQPGA